MTKASRKRSGGCKPKHDVADVFGNRFEQVIRRIAKVLIDVDLLGQVLDIFLKRVIDSSTLSRNVSIRIRLLGSITVYFM